MIWAAVRWVPLMFLIAPAMEAPLVAHFSEKGKLSKKDIADLRKLIEGLDDER